MIVWPPGLFVVGPGASTIRRGERGQHAVHREEKEEVLAAIGGLKKDIVEKP